MPTLLLSLFKGETMTHWQFKYKEKKQIILTQKDYDQIKHKGVIIFTSIKPWKIKEKEVA